MSGLGYMETNASSELVTLPAPAVSVSTPHPGVYEEVTSQPVNV